MARGSGRRATHKNEVKSVNRTAMMIGGIAAGIILLLMIISFAL